MNTTHHHCLAAAVLVLLGLCGAQSATVTINGQTNGPTPFIKQLNLTVSDVAALARIEYKIYPKVGSHTRPVGVRYSTTYLLNRGLLNPATGEITLPVFGLYENYNNRVALVSTFTDQTAQRDAVNMQTVVWNDTTNLYKNPTVRQARVSTSDLSFDFIMLANYQTTRNTPIIIDTDAQVRWVGTANTQSHAAMFLNNGIYVWDNVDANTAEIIRMEMDGTFHALGNPASDPGGVHNYHADGVSQFHHTFDPGKTGILAAVDTYAVPPLDAQVESVQLEIDPTNGAIINRWDMAEIFRSAITAAGEDPSGFVYTGTANPNDWFHNNTNSYRPSDDTLIVSSRENFVVGLDYTTKQIKWLYGDTTKAWYVNYPLSLRPKALNVAPGTSTPIGEHSLSIRRDRLLLFDNGLASLNHTPAGANHQTSAIMRKYLIDAPGMLSTELWSYTANPPIASTLQSSFYEDGSRSYLIDYAGATTPILMALDPSGNKVFDYNYGGTWTTMFNARPVHLEFMEFN